MSTGSMRMCMRVCVCVYSTVFYSAVDNMSSPSPQSEKVENHAGALVHECLCVCTF